MCARIPAPLYSPTPARREGEPMAARTGKKAQGGKKAASTQPVGANGKLLCGARARTAGGRPCRRPAGWGTDHPGSGRCKFHGGLSTGPKNGPGLYRTKLTPELQAIYDKFLTDPNLKRLDEEVALVKSLIVQAMENKYQPGEITELVERLSRVVKRKVEIEEGLKLHVHVDQINFVVNQVVQVIERHVSDPALRAAIAGDLRGVTLAPSR